MYCNTFTIKKDAVLTTTITTYNNRHMCAWRYPSLRLLWLEFEPLGARKAFHSNQLDSNQTDHLNLLVWQSTPTPFPDHLSEHVILQTVRLSAGNLQRGLRPYGPC